MVKAKAVMVVCMDLRLHWPEGTVKKLIEQLELKEYDFVSLVGGAAAEENLLYPQLKASAELHHAPRAILTIHEDCGGVPEEEERHRRLKKACAFAKKLGLEVEAYNLLLDGKFQKLSI